MQMLQFSGKESNTCGYHGVFMHSSLLKTDSSGGLPLQHVGDTLSHCLWAGNIPGDVGMYDPSTKEPAVTTRMFGHLGATKQPLSQKEGSTTSRQKPLGRQLQITLSAFIIERRSMFANCRIHAIDMTRLEGKVE